MLKFFALAAIALAGTPAYAADPAPRTQVAVADLNLGSPAGVAQLDRRLAAAVRRVCPATVRFNLNTIYDHRDCVKTASRSAEDARARVLAQAGNTNAQLAATAR